MRTLLLLCVLICAPCGAQTLSYGRFHDLTIYRPAGEVEQVVLFLSGNEGWSADMASMARALMDEGALVVGIDVPSFIADLERDDASCVFPDGDLENLSRFLQAYYRLPGYRPPVLVGYSSGATLVYAMLAQAPRDMFAGGISLGFCPALPLHKPLCISEELKLTRHGNRADLVPARKLDVPWIAMQAEVDRTCTAAVAQRFVAGSDGGRLVVVPRAGHGDPTADQWTTQLRGAFRQLVSQQHSVLPVTPDELKDLPLVAAPKAEGTDLAVILSGDGGWATIDKALAASLTSRGVAVVGLDSLRYFWRPRTPESTATDVDRIVRHYLAAWKKSRVLLIGYSQGADVLPFVLARLSPQTRASVHLAAMLSPGTTAVFEFHLSSWLSGDAKGLPLQPELQKIATPRLLCLYGEDDTDSVCPELSAANIDVMKLPGGHHFDGDYDRLATLILARR